jgi:hypothetical protein
VHGVGALRKLAGTRGTTCRPRPLHAPFTGKRPALRSRSAVCCPL